LPTDVAKKGVITEAFAFSCIGFRIPWDIEADFATVEVERHDKMMGMGRELVFFRTG
jgi:hypothetical protein